MEKKKITVIVEGGVIQEILDIPDDITIEVHDYDVDTEPDEEDEFNNTVEDENGDYYWKSEWSN